MIQILLVHNEFNKLEFNTYISYTIRVGTCSKWNHVAIRIGNIVIEAQSHGVIKSTYEDWLTRSNRQVLPLTPKEDILLYVKDVLDSEGQSYGFLDIIERIKAIKKERWDGEEYVDKDHKGVICSDLSCILLGIEKNLLPCDFENKAYELGLIKGKVFRTYKE